MLAPGNPTAAVAGPAGQRGQGPHIPWGPGRKAAAAAGALCRWRSAESLLAYVRWNPDQYADRLEKCMATEIDPLHTVNLPHLEPGPLTQIQAVADMTG